MICPWSGSLPEILLSPHMKEYGRWSSKSCSENSFTPPSVNMAEKGKLVAMKIRLFLCILVHLKSCGMSYGILGSCRVCPGCLISIWKWLDQLIMQSFHNRLLITGFGKMVISSTSLGLFSWLLACWIQKRSLLRSIIDFGPGRFLFWLIFSSKGRYSQTDGLGNLQLVKFIPSSSVKLFL